MIKWIREYPITEVLLRLILVMLLFSITRFLFYLFNIESFPSVSGYELLIIFLGGVRFDLTAVLYVNSLYLIVLLLPFNGKNHRIFREIVNSIFYITNGLALFLNCADFSYFKFTSKRTTITVFEEFGNEVNYGSLAYNLAIDYYYIIIIWVLLMGLLVYVSKRIQKELIPINSVKRFFLQFIIFLFFITTAVIGIRGGLPPKQDFPLSPSDAGQYVKRPGNISLVQNTPFTMMMSLDKPVFPKQHYFTETDVEDEYSVLKKPLDSLQFRPLNIVIFIVESLGREPVGVFNKNLDNGNYKGYTPFLDSLAEHALIFVNSYANSRRSIEGSPAVLASIPSLEESFTVSNYSNDKINSLASELKNKGYYSAFFHGAPNGSLGLNSFAVQAGIDGYYGMTEYGNDDDYDGVWGIWDHLFLPYAIHKMDEFKQPFISAIFSVSSHHPNKLPRFLEGKIPEGKIKMHRSIGYADYALREAFKEASSKSWFSNTLFIITGDHTCTSYYPRYQTPVGAFTVPIFFYLPGSELIGVDSTVAQQIDIMPTVLNYLHYNKPYVAFGEDLLAPNNEKFAINYYGNAFQMIMDDWVIQYDLKKTAGLYNLKDDPLMTTNLVNKVPDVQTKMENKIKAVIQQYNNRMVDDKLTFETYY